MLWSIQTVATGGVVFSLGIARRVLQYLSELSTNMPAQEFDAHTQRKREILELIALGYSNAEIAERLVLSPKTVSNHASNMLLKLQVPDRTTLMLMALEAGLGLGDNPQQ